MGYAITKEVEREYRRVYRLFIDAYSRSWDEQIPDPKQSIWDEWALAYGRILRAMERHYRIATSRMKKILKDEVEWIHNDTYWSRHKTHKGAPSERRGRELLTVKERRILCYLIQRLPAVGNRKGAP